MIDFFRKLGAVVVGGFLLGILLDELGQGKLGNVPKMLAQKATRGFGSGSQS